MRRIDRRHYRVLQRLDDNLQLKIEVGDHLSTSASESRSLPAMTLPIIDSQATTTSWCVLPPRATRAAVASMCRSEEHTSELQSLMRISYAVFCLKKKKNK